MCFHEFLWLLIFVFIIYCVVMLVSKNIKFVPTTPTTSTMPGSF